MRKRESIRSLIDLYRVTQQTQTLKVTFDATRRDRHLHEIIVAYNPRTVPLSQHRVKSTANGC